MSADSTLSDRRRAMTHPVRRWQETNDGHLIIEKVDRPSAGNDFERRLRVSSAIPNGVHIGVSIWGVRGNEAQHHTGINLTPDEAIKVMAQIAAVLSHGDHDADRTVFDEQRASVDPIPEEA